MPKQSPQSLITCRDLCKSFGHKIALDHINLEIPAGKIVGLLGRNGAGKTTLIKTWNNLLIPTSGEILIDGQPIGVHTKEIVSYLPERTYLDKSMTIQQALTFFQEFYQNFDREKATDLVHKLNLDPTMKIGKMSKGMQEKLQLILVMSRQAKLYILDEPLGGIDPATREYILDTILSNFNPGASMVISTHLISDVEHILDEVIFIDNGKIILTDSADHLRDQKHASIEKIFCDTFKANIND